MNFSGNCNWLSRYRSRSSTTARRPIQAIRETVAFRQKRKLSILLTVQIERKSWFVCRQSQTSVCVKCSAVPHGPTSRGTCQLFGGLSVEETVEVLKISTQRVLSDWGDSWLMRELKQGL